MSGERSKTERAKGSVKEAIGKLTGDARIEAEGKVQKTAARPDEQSGRARKR